MSEIDESFLTPAESIIVTTFYVYSSHLIITNKRLVGKLIRRSGRRTFKGEIPLDSIISVRYSPGIPIFAFSAPCIWIEHQLPDGSITESRIRFQGGPLAYQASGYTPQQIYELIQDLAGQSADDDGVRHPSFVIERQLEETSKRASRLRGAILMAIVFSISHGLTSTIYSLLAGQTELAGLATILSSVNWVGILGLVDILLFGLIFSTLIAAVLIYYLVDDSYLGSRETIRWITVGVVYALLWQLSSSLFRRFDISTLCMVDILLKIPIAGLSYLLVFRLFSRIRGKKPMPYSSGS